jgi:hypothetical protein
MVLCFATSGKTILFFNYMCCTLGFVLLSLCWQGQIYLGIGKGNLLNIWQPETMNECVGGNPQKGAPLNLIIVASGTLQCPQMTKPNLL